MAAGDRAGLEQLPAHSRPSGDTFGPADADYAYRWWQDELEHAGRHRSWVLPVTVPAGQRDSGGRGGLLHVGLPHVRRSAMSLVSVVAVLLGLGVVFGDGYERCGSARWQSDLQRVPLEVGRGWGPFGRGPTQCVGLSAGQHRFFGDLSDVEGLPGTTKDALRFVEDKILSSNEVAAGKPDHVTIAYLGILSDKTASSYEAVLEELRGLAVAQRDRENKPFPVRLLLANAGASMEYGPQAARAIVEEAGRDPSLKAVVGLGQSRTRTGEAMDELARHNIPMMGTLISATDLAAHTPYYHQVGPTNAREAAVAAAYAAQSLGLQEAVVYYSGDGSDMYSADLHARAMAAFRASDMTVREVEFQPSKQDAGTPALTRGREACKLSPKTTVAFFAGRSEQFADFLDGLKTLCAVPGKYPTVLAGDDITRFVLNGGLAAYPWLQLDYLSLSRGLAAGVTCQQEPSDFLAVYRELFSPRGDCSRARDGRAMLAHDSLYTVLVAVTWAGRDRTTITPDAVWASIKDIRSGDGGGGPVQGKTGIIDFGSTTASSVPVDKAITVWRAVGGTQPVIRLTCGSLTESDRQRAQQEKAARQQADRDRAGKGQAGKDRPGNDEVGKGKTDRAQGEGQAGRAEKGAVLCPVE